jgi:hypothetical protein
VIFAVLTMAAYGSGTGPGTTGNAGLGPDVVQRDAPKTDAPGEQAAERGEQAEERGESEGKGLGNTECQSLKGTGGPAFGHCIAAKAHELHGNGNAKGKSKGKGHGAGHGKGHAKHPKR